MLKNVLYKFHLPLIYYWEHILKGNYFPLNIFIAIFASYIILLIEMTALKQKESVTAFCCCCYYSTKLQVQLRVMTEDNIISLICLS